MTPLEEKQIAKWNNGLKKNISISLILSGDRQKDELESFCENLSSCAQKISVSKRKIDDDSRLSAIQIKDNLQFHAVPLGTELEPFLEALSMLDNGHVQVPESVTTRLEALKLPVFLKLYIAQQCPFCPTVAGKLIPLTSVNKNIHLSIIDGFLFTESAQKDDIRSAPTLLLDNDFRWTGEINLQELIDIIINRDPSRLSADSLENMLKEGNAGRVAEMMIENNVVFPAFIDLLTHEKWPVRLGAMVAMEEIIESSLKLAGEIIDPLWERFPDLEDRVKGDILYIIGKSGNYDNVSKLETIISSRLDSDIREAAKEAVDSIKKRID